MKVAVEKQGGAADERGGRRDLDDRWCYWKKDEQGHAVSKSW